ncbi:sensor histidine kinase [Marispirochaeta aestuarii]|uniref:sensor histidine kinase n=1 Tax=Marispirochaeta aestuarii TaxID=1963862 RepID=UPI0029C8A4A2|nr:sensor histidine kinase [Marispirochaeta aestuarii]
MDKPLNYVYHFILILNLAIVSLLSLVMYQTTFLVCEADQARIFLEQARYLPHVPWHVPVYAIGSFLILAVSGLLKRRLGESRTILTFLLFLADIAITFFIAYNLNFSYKGLFLFIGVGAFFFISKLPLRYIAIGLVMLGYIFSDYDIISVRLNLVSLQDYISFYGPSTQIPLYSIRSTLESLNLMLAILFFQFLIQSKVRENKEFIKVNNELSDKLHQLEILQAKLEESARLKERNRLAHEIHDILGHSLTSISTGLEACIELSKKGGAELHRRLMKIKSVTDKGLTDIRRSVRELKSDAIVKSSLLRALQELINDANALGDHQSVEFTIIGQAVPLEDDEEQTVYRLVQESLTNSFKYSESKAIDVSLRYTANQLSVSIIDDGKGCAQVKKHFGLEHIEEQIALLGGKVRFETAENCGFKTFATIPLRKGGKS